MNYGQEVFLDDLRLDDPCHDGTQLALEYRRARMAGNEKLHIEGGMVYGKDD